MTQPRLSRRSFLARSGYGFGTLALASLLEPNILGAADSDRWAGVMQPVKPRAKRVIFLTMAGGPSSSIRVNPRP